MGDLVVKVLPAAQVNIDGTLMAEVRGSAHYRLPAGKHHLDIISRFGSSSVDVYIAPGQRFVQSVSFNPSRDPYERPEVP